MWRIFIVKLYSIFSIMHIIVPNYSNNFIMSNLIFMDRHFTRLAWRSRKQLYYLNKLLLSSHFILWTKFYFLVILILTYFTLELILL